MTLASLAFGAALFATPAQPLATDSATIVVATDSVAIAAPATPAPEPRKRHRGIPARMGRATMNFAADTWYVVSSPARMNRYAALQTAAVLGATALIYAYDEDIYRASQRNLDEPVVNAIDQTGDVIRPIGFMPNAFKVEGGVWLIGFALRNHGMQEIPLQLIESHLIAGGVRNVVKFVGRTHPFENEGARHFANGTSFPSGHTSVEFEIATILSLHARSRPVTWLLYTAATAGALERVTSRAHWPSDVLIPAVTGIVISRTVVRRSEEREEREHREARLAPEVRMIGDTPALGLAWRF